MFRSARRSILGYARRCLLHHHQHYSTATTRVVDRKLPDAPSTKSRKKLYIGGAVAGGALWIGGLATALNYQRLSSSVVTGTLFMVRYDPRVTQLLGDKIDYADKWPWITGTVNHLKGKVAIAFDVAGENGNIRWIKVGEQEMYKPDKPDNVIQESEAESGFRRSDAVKSGTL